MSGLAKLGDWRLVRRTADGDSRAFEILVHRYRRLLCVLAARQGDYLLPYTGVEEVVNETWYQVLRRIAEGRTKPSVRFSSWLTGICLNVLKQKELRPTTAGRSAVGASAESALAAVEDCAADPEEAAREAELLVALRDCLSARPERDQQLYRLIYVDGGTKVAAAAALGCSEANVRQNLLPRLHKALARCLAEKGFGWQPEGGAN
jgi:RNA polymerase sigma factor (sigma-70 family)